MNDYRILVVDDEEDLCEILKFNLENEGYEVDTANSAEEALKMDISSYHLILLDVMMGEISGFKMANMLKKDKKTARVPIIFITAKDTENDTVTGFNLGADDYISKPFNIKILVARCNNIIQTRKLLQQRFARNDEPKVEDLPFNPIDKKMLMDATAIVESYIDNADFDVATFAREMCMSRTLLFTKLKALTGQTPNDFILSLRLKKATEKLINDPNALIADIAFDYGFSNPSYFIRCFKNAYDITPAAYRRKYTNA